MRDAPDRERTLMDFYRAFNGRDLEAAVEPLAPEVDWGTDAGSVRGRAAVRALFEREWQASDPRIEPLRIDEGDDGKVHVRVHRLVLSRDGKVLDDRRIEHVITFDGAFVSRLDVIEADPHPEDDEDDDEDGDD